MSNLNSVDAIILLIFGFSILMGFMRGFLKEVVSIITWIVAAYVAITFATPLAAHFAGGAAASAQNAAGSGITVAHSITTMAVVVSFIALFIGTLFLGSVVGYILASAVSITGLGFFNRILGGVFGFGRGYIMAVVFMFLAELTSMGAQPAWTQSQLVNSLQPSVVWFASMAGPELQAIKAMGSAAIQNYGGQIKSSVSGAMQNVTGK